MLSSSSNLLSDNFTAARRLQVPVAVDLGNIATYCFFLLKVKGIAKTANITNPQSKGDTLAFWALT